MGLSFFNEVHSMSLGAGTQATSKSRHSPDGDALAMPATDHKTLGPSRPLSHERDVVILDLGAPATNEPAVGDRSVAPVRVNFQLWPVPIIVIGHNTLSYAMHAQMSNPTVAVVTDYLQQATSSGEQTISVNRTYPLDSVISVLKGDDCIIVIRDESTLVALNDSEAVQARVNCYKAAIQRAQRGVSGSGGTVYIAPVGGGGSVIAGHLRDMCAEEFQEDPLLEMLTDVHSGRSTNEIVELIQDGTVAGFQIGDGISVRLEGIPLTDQVRREKILAQYRLAIRMAECAAMRTGGKVTVYPCGRDGLQIAMMLGELHRVDASNREGVQFIKRSTRIVPGSGLFLCSLNGERYKTITQLRKDLFEPDRCQDPAMDSPARYETREACLSFLQSLIKIIDPDLRNPTGQTREAQLLFVDPETQKVRESRMFDHTVRKNLQFLHDYLAEHFNQDVWPLQKDEIRRRISSFIDSLLVDCHPIAHVDDPSNQNQVALYAALLRGEGCDINLVEGHDTPETPVNLGRFVTEENGQRHFRYSDGVDDATRRAAEDIFRLYPRALESAWFCMCVPTRRLTEDFHLPGYRQAFGDPEDKSVIVLFGTPGGDQYEVVTRVGPFNPDSWKDRRSERVIELLKKFTPNVLTELVHFAKGWQVRLYNRLLQGAGMEGFNPKAGRDIPPFESDGCVETRRYILGKRLDRIRRDTLTMEQVKAFLRLLGPVSVANFLAQRPVFPLREILLVESDAARVPSVIMPIGTSETFCGSVCSGISSQTYRSNIAPLYGAHIASWIVAFEYGSCGHSLSEPEKLDCAKELIEIWGRSFLTSYKRAVAERIDISNQFDGIRSLECQLIASYGEIPTEFSLAQHLPLTERLMDLNEHEIKNVANTLSKCAGAYLLKFRQLLKPPDNFTDYSKVDELNQVILGVISDHLLTRLDRLSGFIDGWEIDFSRFSIQERIWLWNLVDVCVWFSEMTDDKELLKDIVQKLFAAAVGNNGSVSTVIQVTEGLEPPMRPGLARVEKFYAAVQGLTYRCLTETDPERRNEYIIAVKIASFNLLNFRERAARPPPTS